MSADREHLAWIYDRLINVHNESPNLDYMLRFCKIINGSDAPHHSPSDPMTEPLPTTTLAWLRQTAKLEGAVTAQVLLHLLERVEVLEQRPIPGFVELAAPAPEAANVAILNHMDYDKALTPGDVLKAQIRACYNLGRQHGATPPAPEPVGEPLAARPLLEKVARLGDCIGQQTVAQVQQLAEQASAWLRDNPPGKAVAIEPRGCPAPGACSCVEPTPPAPEVGEVGELSPKEVEAQNAFTQLRDEVLNLSGDVEVNEVLAIIDYSTPEWV